MYMFHQIQTEEHMLKQYAYLFKQAFKINRHLTRNYLKWLYVDNPLGEVLGFNAFDSVGLAAHYACIPIQALLNGEPSTGLLSLNTATHPNHQGKGLFTGLANATYNKVREQGFEFVVGVANANSTPGFIGKLGFHLVKPLDVRIGFGLPRRVSETKGSLQFNRIWTQESIEWRLSNPSNKYRVENLSDGQTCVYAKTGRAGICAVLFDSCVSGLNIVNQKSFLNWNPIKLWLGLDPLISWDRSFYYNIPESLRPSPLNLIFKDLTGQGICLDPDKTRLTGLDFDVY